LVYRKSRAGEARSLRRGTNLEFRLDKTVLEGVLGDFPGPIRHIKVDETKWEPLWDRLVREHHYLGYDSVIEVRSHPCSSLERRKREGIKKIKVA
jgi:hypothetical protein